MKASLRSLTLGATTAALLAISGPLSAQPTPPYPNSAPTPPLLPPPPPVDVGALYDLQQLPATKGVVSRYTLTPRGDVDGLILADGTEAHVPPHLSTQLVYIAKPGDAVTIHGLRLLSAPLINAVSVTNDATGLRVIDNDPVGGPKGRRAEHPVSVQGHIQRTLHGPRGEVNGALLDDGAILRLPPSDAVRLASLLTAGQSIAVQGNSLTMPMGQVIEVQALGPSSGQLTWLQPTPPDRRGPRP